MQLRLLGLRRVTSITCGAGKEREERDVGGGGVAKAEDMVARMCSWKCELSRGRLLVGRMVRGKEWDMGVVKRDV